MNNNNNMINSLLNQHQMPQQQHFDPTLSSHDDFLEQMLSSVPFSSTFASSSFQGNDDDSQMEAMLASKLRQHQISNGAAKALMVQQQQQFLMPSSRSNTFLPPMPPIGDDQNDFVDCSSFKPIINPVHDDVSVKALFNSLSNGSLGQTSNQPPHFNNPQAQSFGAQAISGSSGMSTVGQPKQRVRARRGQATDPHSIAERLRRERIAERMKGLQELVPNANKTDKASMLDEIIDYVKFLQLQVKVLSMSRLGGAAAVAPLVADISEGRIGNGTQTSSSPNNDGMTVTEHQVVKLMEEDMGSAMQYLQGKGLCLMPISLATAISTTTSHSRKPFAPSNPNGPMTNNPLLNGEGVGPTSPSMPALTPQSNGGGERSSFKDVSVTRQ